MKNYLKRLSMRDLKAELKEANRDVKYAEKELISAESRRQMVVDLINNFPKQLKFKSVPKDVKQLSSKKRYFLFNEMIRRGGHSAPYRDRATGNGVSVKPQVLTIRERNIARKLADEVSVTKHSGKDCYSYYCNGSGKVHRVERYIFRNVLGPQKPVACPRGRRIRWKANHTMFDSHKGVLRRLEAWKKHVESCKQCQAYQATFKK